MEIEDQRSRQMAKRLTRFGLYGTLVYIVVLVGFAGAAWDPLWDMQPYEFAAVMGGIFSPLAFLWLVLGYFQQGSELRLQIKELQKTVRHHGQLVDIAKKDVALQANIAQSHEDREALKSAARFSVSSGVFVDNADGRVFVLELVNRGQPAHFLTLKTFTNMSTHHNFIDHERDATMIIPEGNLKNGEDNYVIAEFTNLLSDRFNQMIILMPIGSSDGRPSFHATIGPVTRQRA
ncbi:hypothetical protein [Novosphingobium aquae]|uniref:Uncharacterized protein n=1 Tax=Novosphingobium aquae TaxID=3133435 RepID=A0ABU8S5B1_9SPHN